MAVTLALGLFTVGTMVYFAISDTEKTLLSILSTASAWTEGSTENLPNLARQIAQSAPPLRVIFLLPQGIVLVDSAEATQVAMENMLAFPEIQGALQGLESSSIRLSGGVPTIYAARLLSDRLLIHLSFSADGRYAPFVGLCSGHGRAFVRAADPAAAGIGFFFAPDDRATGANPGPAFR